MFYFFTLSLGSLSGLKYILFKFTIIFSPINIFDCVSIYADLILKVFYCYLALTLENMNFFSFVLYQNH